jgi:hypothetical protein
VKLSATMIAPEKFPPAVIGLVMIAQGIPAAVAAFKPFSESSKIKASLGAIPNESAAVRNNSGSGLIFWTSSRFTNALKCSPNPSFLIHPNTQFRDELEAIASSRPFALASSIKFFSLIPFLDGIAQNHSQHSSYKY